MKHKALKILFFTMGAAPTAAQLREAQAMNANVCFRNATVVPNEPHALEDCHGVAGDVPPIYAAKYPAAEAALEARENAVKALAEKVGDGPAPQPPAKPASAAKGGPKADDKAPTPPAPAGGWTGQGTAPAGGK